MMEFRTKESAQVRFNEVRNSGVFIAQTEANHKDSMSLLKQNGFRPLTYQEALVKIDQNPKLKKQLKDKWFYLDGEGSQLSGYYTFKENGKLKVLGEISRKEVSIEKTVLVERGSQPLLLVVNTDDLAYAYNGRFILYAYYSPRSVALVVVGVLDESLRKVVRK